MTALTPNAEADQQEQIQRLREECRTLRYHLGGSSGADLNCEGRHAQWRRARFRLHRELEYKS
jgi:hypothetical protein